jgi:hypothetical protein
MESTPVLFSNPSKPTTRRFDPVSCLTCTIKSPQARPRLELRGLQKLQRAFDSYIPQPVSHGNLRQPRDAGFASLEQQNVIRVCCDICDQTGARVFSRPSRSPRISARRGRTRADSRRSRSWSNGARPETDFSAAVRARDVTGSLLYLIERLVEGNELEDLLDKCVGPALRARIPSSCPTCFRGFRSPCRSSSAGRSPGSLRASGRWRSPEQPACEPYVSRAS